ncbi:MAG: TonB family protein [Planctomycetes bacterium]|nr:TonB family protein [Planctomycetota bacterium]
MRASFLLLSCLLHGAVLGTALVVHAHAGGTVRPRANVEVRAQRGSEATMTLVVRERAPRIEFEAQPADDAARRPVATREPAPEPPPELSPVEFPAETAAELLARLGAGAQRELAEAERQRPVASPDVPPKVPLGTVGKHRAMPPAADTDSRPAPKVAEVAHAEAPWIDAVRAADNEAPRFPEAERRAGHEGTVVVAVEVDAAGRVVSVELQSGCRWPGLNREALRAVRGWRFEPARRVGVAVPTSTMVTVEFRLQDAATK